MTYQFLKRNFLFLLAFTFIVIPSFGTSALAAGPITVTAPTMSTGPVSDFVVSITASDTTGMGATGFDARIVFDPAVIQPTGANFGCSLAGTLFAGASVTCNIFPAPNILSITVFAITPITGTGRILNVTFQPVGAAGTSSPLIFNTFTFNEGDPTNTTVNGLVNILNPTAAGVTISGRIFNRYNRPLSRARILLTDSDGVQRIALSNPFGYFRFRDVPAGRDYILAAIAKRYTFSSQLISLVDNVSGIVLRPDDTGFGKGISFGNGISKGRPAPLQ